MNKCVNFNSIVDHCPINGQVSNELRVTNHRTVINWLSFTSNYGSFLIWARTSSTSAATDFQSKCRRNVCSDGFLPAIRRESDSSAQHEWGLQNGFPSIWMNTRDWEKQNLPFASFYVQIWLPTVPMPQQQSSGSQQVAGTSPFPSRKWAE